MIPQKNPLIASGESVHANMLTKLWENPAPTSAFAAQDISLVSDDYDFLLWIFRFASTVTRDTSIISKKGDGFAATFAGTGGTGIYNIYRYGVYNSDTSFSISNCNIQFAGQPDAQDNARILPIAIYGFKKSLDITAIVSNVSTDATKCILSDNVTNVDDAVKYKLVTLTGATTSVAANSYATISLSGSIPSGYTPISIIKFEAGNTGIDVELVSTNYMRVYNNMGSAKNAAPEVIVACVKSSIVS